MDFPNEDYDGSKAKKESSHTIGLKRVYRTPKRKDRWCERGIAQKI